jgi:hypothetical protein
VFANLRTTVAEIDMYLMKNGTLRRFVKDLVPYRAIASDMGKTPQPGSVKAKTLASTDAFFEETDMSYLDFYAAYKRVFETMGAKPVTNRLSSHLTSRLVAMSGLIWNRQSGNSSRDWPITACAFAIEAMVLPTYRQAMLISCPGAHLLRKHFRDLFLPHSFSVPLSGLQWEFADNIPVIADTNTLVPDADDIARRWDLVHTVYVDGANDPAVKFIQSLQTNKFLLSSAPGAQSGTLETLAHFLITALADVRLPFLLFAFLFHHPLLRLSLRIRLASPTLLPTQKTLIPSIFLASHCSLSLSFPTPCHPSISMMYALLYFSPHLAFCLLSLLPNSLAMRSGVSSTTRTLAPSSSPFVLLPPLPFVPLSHTASPSSGNTCVCPLCFRRLASPPRPCPNILPH